LRVGSTGTDVIALQTFLEQRGLLELPPGVVNGRFGPLTSAALAEYQTTVGLPGVGVLGPLTMGKINAELASRPILPNTGLTGLAGTTIGTQEISSSSNTTAVTAASSLTFYQALVQFIKNLYATPFDGLITTLLLALVGFVVFRIVRVLVK
jgi:peptidoglycan hydrolase-like protein with peptidoglycan-binding domain